MVPTPPDETRDLLARRNQLEVLLHDLQGKHRKLGAWGTGPTPDLPPEVARRWREYQEQLSVVNARLALLQVRA